MIDHTPTPWHVSQSGADDYRILGPNPDAGKEHVSYSGDLLQVATTDSPEEAAFIVRAVNAHDALVAALRVLLESAEGAHYKCDTGTVECYDDMAPGEHDGIQQAQAAIAAAEGDAS